MGYVFTGEASVRLGRYVAEIGDALRNKKRRSSFATYFVGLLGDGERKSVEPIAARAAGEPGETRAVTERLLHFLGDSQWDDQGVRRLAAREAIGALVEREPVDSWVIDDTGFLKQGKKSPGVQRQYTGTAGKTTNCQIDRPDRAEPPVHYTLTTLPKAWSHKQIVRRTKQRWRIERTDQDLKGELGFEFKEGVDGILESVATCPFADDEHQVKGQDLPEGAAGLTILLRGSVRFVCPPSLAPVRHSRGGLYRRQARSSR